MDLASFPERSREFFTSYDCEIYKFAEEFKEPPSNWYLFALIGTGFLVFVMLAISVIAIGMLVWGLYQMWCKNRTHNTECERTGIY